MAGTKSTDHESSWSCNNGHPSGTYLILNRDRGGVSIMGGSSWDLCDECGESPAASEIVRMRLDIFEQWARAGVITAAEHSDFREKLGVEEGVRSWGDRMANALNVNALNTGAPGPCAYPNCPENGQENWYRKDPESGSMIRTPLCAQHDAMVPRSDPEAERFLTDLAGEPA